MSFEEIFDFALSEAQSRRYNVEAGEFMYDIAYLIASLAYPSIERCERLEENAFALTAVGEKLDLKVAEQGMDRKASTYSSGTVRLKGDRGAVINEGTIIASDTLLFETESTVIIPEIGYIDTTAICCVPGTIGNVDKNTINRIPVTVPGLTSVTNITAFSGGYDEEDDEKLRQRWIDKTHNPINGGNINQIEQWAKEVDGVGDAMGIDLWDGPGTVKVIVSGMDSTAATESVLSAVREKIENRRVAGGGEYTFESAQEYPVNVNVKIIGNAAQEDITESLRVFLSKIGMKKGYISYGKINQNILSVAGVEDCSNLLLNGEKENVVFDAGYVPVLGEVTFE